MKKTWILETTWNKDCPLEVNKEVGNLWSDYLEYGNDYYYWSTSLDELKQMLNEGTQVKAIIDYVEPFVDDSKEQILIHYWW